MEKGQGNGADTLQTDKVFTRKEYIEREATVKAIESVPDGNWRSIRYAKEVKAIPTADVVPVRHGRWKEENPDCLDGDSVYVCSVCGETWTLIEGTPLDNNMHYCPNCGARMDGDVE